MKDKTILLIRKWFNSKTGIDLIHDPSLISLVNEIEALHIHDVVGRSEQLNAFVDFYNNRKLSHERINYDEIEIFLESI